MLTVTVPISVPGRIYSLGMSIVIVIDIDIHRHENSTNRVV